MACDINMLRVRLVFLNNPSAMMNIEVNSKHMRLYKAHKISYFYDCVPNISSILSTSVVSVRASINRIRAFCGFKNPEPIPCSL